MEPVNERTVGETVVQALVVEDADIIKEGNTLPPPFPYPATPFSFFSTSLPSFCVLFCLIVVYQWIYANRSDKIPALQENERA